MPQSYDLDSARSLPPSSVEWQGVTPRSQQELHALIELLKAAHQILRPKPLRDPAQWADDTRVLPIGSAEPGPFRAARTPYMLPFQRACVDPRIRRVTMVCGSQMGKTDSVLNIIGRQFDDDPQPTLYVGPTRGMVEKIIEPRMLAMMRSSATLWGKTQKGRAASKTAKRIAGVLLRLAWAGSAAELASQEVALAILDELDRMDLDIEGEGSPIELVDARLATFPDSKMIITSTPTDGNVVPEKNPETGLSHWRWVDPSELGSAVWRMWQEGTREEWAWPCLHCGEYFIPRFELLRWPEGASPAKAKREARLVCPHCGSELADNAKTDMNSRGRFAAPGQSISPAGELSGEREFNDHRSFWVSGLCSPWMPWGKRAADYVAAVRSSDHARIKGVVTLQFGQVWQVGGDAPEWQEVRRQADTFPGGHVPEGVLCLTAGVDVQKHRIVYAVRAWGYGLESWLVSFGDCWGETSAPDVWQQLRQVLEAEYSGHTVKTMLIDSGYKPGEDSADHAVYRFCRETNGRAVPTKGHESLSKPLHAATIDVRYSGKVIKRGLQLWHFDTDHFKSFIHGRLRLPIDAAAGRWHLPCDVSEDYCQQLTAEARVAKASGRATWVRRRRENHALDAEVLNVVAAYMLGLHMLRRPEQKQPPAEPPPTPPPPHMRHPSDPGARWAAAPPPVGGAVPFATGWRR